MAFFISIVTLSTSAATTITFLLYLLGNVLNNLASIYKISIFKYVVSLHWDFSYLVNRIPNPYGYSFSFSLIIIGIYLFIILCLSYLIFIKKDVKNI